MEEMVTIEGISCYGALTWDSNFEVICEDEEDDCFWIDGNVETGGEFKSWEDVVAVLCEHLDGKIEQITTI